MLTAIAAMGLPIAQPAGAQAQQGNLLYGGVGFATQVRGGGLPVQSGKTAHSWLGCVGETGVTRQNGLANLDLDDLIKVGASTTRNQSVQRPNGARGSITTNEVGDVRIGTDELFIALTGVKSEARAFQQSNGSFTRWRGVEIGTAKLGLLGQQFDLPTDLVLDQLISRDGLDLSLEGALDLLATAGLLTNPAVLGFLLQEAGLGTLWTLLQTLGVDAVLNQLGGVTGLINTLLPALSDQLDLGMGSLGTIRGRLGGSKADANGSRAGAVGIRVDLLDLAGAPAQVVISRSFAKVGSIVGHPTGGNAFAADLSVLGGVVGTGRIANQPLPCEGTGGQWRQNSTVGLNVPGVVNLGAATSRTRSTIGANGATNAFAQSSIASIDLGGGSLVIQGIETRAHARKLPNGTRERFSDGTTVASITANGTTYPVPNPGETLVIPGVAEISVGKVTRLPKGLRVTGVEVKLLGGDVVTLELGYARAIVE